MQLSPTPRFTSFSKPGISLRDPAASQQRLAAPDRLSAEAPEAKAQLRTGTAIKIVVIQEGGPGRVLDSPSAGIQWDGKPCRRTRLERGAQATPTHQDRRVRRRDACAHTYGVQAARATRLLDGGCAKSRGGRPRRLSRERRTLTNSGSSTSTVSRGFSRPRGSSTRTLAFLT